ncbi:GspH/FimT family protein [Anaerobacillus sp. CMMVII]|uniref:competence type IV pilus minor pilin ComGD n=1 Tax=Anaerobacillus sp. CMMVII TaxID=2755588 RepID=UPI0021B7A4A3|nr:competence type IV pilus minor pilin ComGD [Anaerobacillus sp. CMMVII]MCT8138671.1 GspH/FimT family protein [Anaerobacillus sp. CMMVII]
MMKHLLRNEKGHSLLEMTLVLFMFAVVSAIPLVQFESTMKASDQKQFMYQLQQDLYYAQQLAMSKQLTTTVVFLNGSKEYVIRQGGVVIFRRPYKPEDVVFVQGTLTLTDIAFLPNGNAQKSGSLTIRMGEQRFRLVMLLGRGRFYIEEL